MDVNEGLKREIGVWGLVANSINIIVGAGIFILPVIIAERLGTGSILAYLICGILMIFIMLCFAEVGTKITRTGGAYSYIEDAFGRYAGFITTNVFIFGAAVMANAVVANGLVNTLAYTDFRDAPLAEAARRMIGPAGATIVIIGALFSMFGNISGMVLNMPRVLFAAARDRVIPLPGLAKVHPEFLTPHVSIIIYACLGFIFASPGEFKQLAMLSSASYLLIYLGVVFSVIKFRINRRTEEGSYIIPEGYFVPGFSAVVIIWVLSNLPLKELGAMVIFISLLTLIYFILKIFKLEK